MSTSTPITEYTTKINPETFETFVENIHIRMQHDQVHETIANVAANPYVIALFNDTIKRHFEDVVGEYANIHPYNFDGKKGFPEKYAQAEQDRIERMEYERKHGSAIMVHKENAAAARAILVAAGLLMASDEDKNYLSEKMYPDHGREDWDE